MADFGEENGYMRRILEGKRNKWRELPFLWPTPRARSTFRAFLFRSESPTAPRKAGDGLGSPDGWKPKSGRKRGTGDTAGPNNAVQIKKKGCRGPRRGDDWRCSKARDTEVSFKCFQCRCWILYGLVSILSLCIQISLKVSLICNYSWSQYLFFTLGVDHLLWWLIFSLFS
jgi:hypothetical protein